MFRVEGIREILDVQDFSRTHNSSTLKMEVLRCSEAVGSYKIHTAPHSNGILHSHNRENLKSYKQYILL
jgi:hypothetical protein